MTNVLARFGAPWSAGLRAMTLIAMSVLAAVAVIGIVTHQPLMVVVALLIAVAPAPWAVLGYGLTPDAIEVQRLGWTLSLPLKSLQSATAEPGAMRGSVRLMGNGGLFAFTGLFRSQALGRYRAFATDPARAVILRYADRTIVVTPDEPERFIQRVRHTAGLSG